MTDEFKTYGKLRRFSKAFMSCVLLAGIPAFATAAENVKISGFTWPGYGFWHIAIEKGLAPDLNIDYQAIEDPYESFNLVAADKMDVVSSTVEFTPVGVERGLPVKLVAFGNLSYGTDKIIGAPGITSAADLVGKEVAVLEGGLSQIYVAMWLEQNGIAFDAVKYRNIIADDALAAMVGGAVAASEFLGTIRRKHPKGSGWLQRTHPVTRSLLAEAGRYC